MEISDEVVEVALKAFNTSRNYAGETAGIAMRSALQASIPLLVEGFVPSEKIDSNNDRDPAMQNYRYGYNSCRRDILAKVKK